MRGGHALATPAVLALATDKGGSSVASAKTARKMTASPPRNRLGLFCAGLLQTFKPVLKCPLMSSEILRKSDDFGYHLGSPCPRQPHPQHLTRDSLRRPPSQLFPKDL